MQRNITNIEYELRTLLANLRKTVELCFFTEVQQHQQQETYNILESENGKQFLIACLEILQHQLILNQQCLDDKDEHLKDANDDADITDDEKQNVLKCLTKINGNQSTNHIEKILKKFIEDFEYLYETTQLRQTLKTYNVEGTRLNRLFLNETNYLRDVKSFLLFWLTENLKTKCLTLCLQALIADNELKDLYYEKGAFLQSEDYATAFCICVSSIEQNQYNFISQIQPQLYQQNLMTRTTITTTTATTKSNSNSTTIKEKIDFKPRRTGSHPNISFGHLSHLKYDKRKRYLTICSNNEDILKARKTARQRLSAIRKTKSLPNILSFPHFQRQQQQREQQQQQNQQHQKYQKKNPNNQKQQDINSNHYYKHNDKEQYEQYQQNVNDFDGDDDENLENFTKEAKKRPRCKTLDNRIFTNILNSSEPKQIPKRLITNVEIQIQPQTSSSNTSFSASHDDDLDCKPSTSKQSLIKHLSSTPNTATTLSNTSSSISSTNSNSQSHSHSHSHSHSNLHSNSQSNSNSNSISYRNLNSNLIAKHIEIINCDNIKIWTDQSFDEATTSNNSDTNSSIIIDFPTNSSNVPKTGKSLSPLNNFFSNLFGTPPTYTSWSPKQYQDCHNLEAMDACNAFPCNKLQSTSSPITSSVFDAFLPTVGKKLRTRKSQTFFEDGISTLDYSIPSTTSTSNDRNKFQQTSNAISIEVPAATTHSLSSIRSTQTLTDYLKMSQLSRNSTELEKENAHFRISEAIISAIEHIKWAKMDSQSPNDKNGQTTQATDWLEKDQQNLSNRTDEAAQKSQMEHNDLLEHTPYAESGCYDEFSAEIIGLSIISKFNDKQVPKVSELKWLVSDEDTPQNLLPMPDNSPTCNPDENVAQSLTRGTRYWAPPRQQIIFTDHPAPNRKALLLKQNYRCAGCGMRVAQQNMSSFRYCTYLGKYHCTGCHRNQMSVTPAKILQMWDFKCYPVSVFAYRLLEQMYNYPLFYVPDLNPALYVEAKALRNSRQKRRQLSFVKLFVKACRFAIREQQYFAQIPEYITDDPDLWSLSDFMDVFDKSMERSIEDLIMKCENHIHNCVLCTARGFYCEHCTKDQIIFPWEKKTFRCDRCGTCYHSNCWQSMSEACKKCQRLNKRQEQDVF